MRNECPWCDGPIVLPQTEEFFQPVEVFEELDDPPQWDVRETFMDWISWGLQGIVFVLICGFALVCAIGVLALLFVAPAWGVVAIVLVVLLSLFGKLSRLIQLMERNGQQDHP